MDNEQENIITLRGNNGEDIDFIEIMNISLESGFYVILQPVVRPEGMEEDEALVFRVAKVGGKEKLEIELDDDIINAVFEEYNRILDEEGAAS